MIGRTIKAPEKVREEYKQLTEDDKSLQGRLKVEFCSHLYLERYPTGYKGTFEPIFGYKCELTEKDCVAKRNAWALIFRNDEASQFGLNVKIAERCPKREIEG